MYLIFVSNPKFNLSVVFTIELFTSIMHWHLEFNYEYITLIIIFIIHNKSLEQL